jgi:transcriptional regulator with XRE-family HTH domain
VVAETLGALVRRLRKQAGMTQFQLAERAGLGERTIGRIENDKPFDHRSGTFARLADALEAGPEDRRRLMAASIGSGDEPPPVPARQTAPPAARVPGPLADEADGLARESRRRWREEEAQRRVHHPYALPVRWQHVATGLADRTENAQGAAPGDALPDIDLSGDLRRVAGVYRRIGSGRLVVLGRAGSGKSILAVRFALDLLDTREHAQRVPVIFSLGSWDPTAIALRDWLVDRLVRDHPHLARVLPSGKPLAADLFDADLVLPVLDGFDEIAEELRGEALQALNRTVLPLVLTSRRDEFAGAVAAARAPLASAVVIELRDLDPADLRDYLPRTVPVPPGPLDPAAPRGWNDVLDRARTAGPAGAHLTEALSTPLMTALARTMYSDNPDRDPAELLDTARFPDAAAIEAHLLAGFVPTVYRRRAPQRPDAGGPAAARRGTEPQWELADAQRWLGYIAHHLAALDGERQDIAWWELGTSMSRLARTVIVGLLAGTAFGVTAGVGNIPVDLVATSHGPAFALLRGLAVGVLHGLAAAVLFGLVYWYATAREGLKPSPVRIRFAGRGRRGGRLRRTGRRVRVRVAVGLLCGLSVAAALELLDQGLVGPLGLDDGQGGGALARVVFIAELGLGAGLVFALTAVLEAPVRPESVVSPADLLGIDRRNVAYHLLVWALAIGPAAGLLNGIVDGPVRGLEVGVVFGLEAAFGAGLGYGVCMTAWGQWVALARIWLPLTGRLPWALVSFLDDAHRRGVLRQVGAVYQFRHSRIQSQLGRAFREHHGKRRPARPDTAPAVAPGA